MRPRTILFIIAMLALPCTAQAKTHLPGHGQKILTGRAYIEVEPGAKPPKGAVHAVTTPHGEMVNWYRLDYGKHEQVTRGNSKARAVEAKLDELEGEPGVVQTAADVAIPTETTPNDPLYGTTTYLNYGTGFGDSWNLQKIGMSSWWSTQTSGDVRPIAVIDTGVDTGHPQLSGRIYGFDDCCDGVDDDGNGKIDDYQGWDFIDNDNTPQDVDGHGTFVAGIIGAHGNDSTEITGVNWFANILPLRSIGTGSVLQDTLDALDYVADKNGDISVANNSYAYTDYISPPLDAAFNAASDAGTNMVAAAGNDGADDVLDASPHAARSAIVVGATGSSDQIADFSNVGSKVDVVAPGGDFTPSELVLSLKSSSDTTNTAVDGAGHLRTGRGTSFAAPVASALLSTWRRQVGCCVKEQARQMLRLSATDLGSGGRDDTFGYGRVSASGMQTRYANNNDAVAPAPELTSPYMEWVTGTKTITGSIVDYSGSPSLSSYTLSYGSGRSPSSWTTIGTGSTYSGSNSWNTTGVSDGNYTLRLQAADSASETRSFFAFDVKVDNTGPYAPTNLTVRANAANQQYLDWTAATDNYSGVVSYNIYRGGSLVGTSTTPKFTSTGLSASTSYSYYVRAVDAAGNEGTTSTTISATTGSNTSKVTQAGVVRSVNSSGAVIPGVNVTATDSSTHVLTESTTTDASGWYRLVNLTANTQYDLDFSPCPLFFLCGFAQQHQSVQIPGLFMPASGGVIQLLDVNMPLL